MTPIESISDTAIAVLIAECRNGADEHGGMGHEYDSGLFDRLGDALEQMQSRLRAAEADADRLEWMIDEGCIVQHQNGTASPTVFRVYWPAFAEQQPDWYPSDREAIDAAMERTP